MVIGRQSTALLENRNIFPDLLGLDKDGNIVIVELKKGKTPREVITQLLEYASWANDLSDDEIHDITSQYFLSNTEYEDKSLENFYEKDRVKAPIMFYQNKVIIHENTCAYENKSDNMNTRQKEGQQRPLLLTD